MVQLKLNLYQTKKKYRHKVYEMQTNVELIPQKMRKNECQIKSRCTCQIQEKRQTKVAS